MTPELEYEPDARGWSPFGVALIATLVLLLGLGGALFGIQAANRPRAVEPGGTIPAVLPTLPPAPTATAAPTPTPTAAPTPTPTAFGVPDVAGDNFELARAEIRALRLGVQLVFEGTDPAVAEVRATDPAAGTAVVRGTTVKVFVRGAAPPATVPDVRGLTCAAAARAVGDAGLFPRYPRGRAGSVISQVPAATDPPSLRWNDTVQLVCG